MLCLTALFAAPILSVMVAGWDAKGIVLGTPGSDQLSFAIAPDGAGGVACVWRESRRPPPERWDGVSATILDYYGRATAGWGPYGLECSPPLTPTEAPAITDVDGGIVVGWVDGRDFRRLIAVQRYERDGTVSPGWSPFGELLSPDGMAYRPLLVNDGQGGAYVGWRRGDFNGVIDLRMSHVDARGNRTGAWTDTGSVISSNVAGGFAMAPDLAGGTIVTWTERTSNVLRCQRFTASGERAAGWPLEGAVACSTGGWKTIGFLHGTAEGGAMIVWQDERTDEGDVYLAVIDGTGLRVSPDSGRVLSGGLGFQGEPTACPDESGGAFVAWTDSRDGTFRIYATRIADDGSTAPFWPDGGRVVESSGHNQFSCVVVTGKDRGPLLVWKEMRSVWNGIPRSIIARRLGRNGEDDFEWGPGLKVADADSSLGVMMAVGDNASGFYVAWSEYDPDPSAYLTRTVIQHVSGSGVVGPPRPLEPFTARAPYPNPARGGTRISFVARGDAEIEVDIFDVGGRRVRSLLKPFSFSPGEHSVQWDGSDDSGRPAKPGIYLSVIRSADRATSKRISLIR